MEWQPTRSCILRREPGSLCAGLPLSSSTQVCIQAKYPREVPQAKYPMEVPQAKYEGKSHLSKTLPGKYPGGGVLPRAVYQALWKDPCA